VRHRERQGDARFLIAASEDASAATLAKPRATAPARRAHPEKLAEEVAEITASELELEILLPPPGRVRKPSKPGGGAPRCCASFHAVPY
jgi:hypothetical protein